MKIQPISHNTLAETVAGKLAASLLDARLKVALEGLLGKTRTELRDQRYAKFRSMGAVQTVLKAEKS